MMLRLLLKTYREHHRLSLRDLGQRTGISYVTLHRFEKGRTITHTAFTKLWNWLLNEEVK